MRVITLNTFEEMFGRIANGHGMLNDYGFGPSYNIGQDAPMKYPFLWVEPVSTTLLNGGTGTGTSYLTQTYQFHFIVFDKINKGDGNYNQTSSDTDYILKTIIAELDQDPYWINYSLSLDGDISFEPVFEQLTDNANGWQALLTFRSPMWSTPCNSPITI